MKDVFFFFFQAEGGIRDLVRSRGLGDVYRRRGRHATQLFFLLPWGHGVRAAQLPFTLPWGQGLHAAQEPFSLSLIHI